jgi:hypothetical protein
VRLKSAVAPTFAVPRGPCSREYFRAPPVHSGWEGEQLRPTIGDTDEAVPEVLAAFQAARQAGCAPVDCYRAGVAAWRRHHPDQAREYAAKRAVAVILAHNIEIKVTD